MHSRESRHGRIRETIWQRADSNHAQDLEAIVLQRESQGFKPLVLAYEPVHVV